MLGYSSLEGVSFADTNIEWENCTTAEEQAEAFKAYCKSRDLTIEGSIADGVTSFTTHTYQNLVNTLGLDINALQADIKKTTDSNGVTKFLFNVSGISAMNRIFSQFLQDHELEVGDTANENDNIVYSGVLFTDNSNYSSLCNVSTSNSTNDPYSHISAFGTPYHNLTYSYIKSIMPIAQGDSNKYEIFTYHVNDNNDDPLTLYNGFLGSYSTSSMNIQYSNFYKISTVKTDQNFSYNNRFSKNSYVVITYVTTSSKFYITYNSYSIDGSTLQSLTLLYTNPINPRNAEYNVNIYLTTNNQTINNNNYTNNTYTTINNDGDVYNYDTDDEPDPDTPVTPDPPTPDDPSGGNPPDDWDIELPDLSNTDWVIYGLEKKFPWDIPFNMMFILSLLNAEPVTPHFEGTIDLKVCTWNYDLDLEPFDTIAGYVREFMFLSFIIGLMLMTKNLIWG